MMDGFEIVIDGNLTSRARRFMQSLSASAPEWSTISSQYSGARRKVLVAYGPGDPVRKEYLARHIAAGGRTAVWDMGYWDRADSMRLAIDGQHPTHEHLALSPPVSRRNFQLREDSTPNGPVMLVGLGAKTVAMLGGERHTWEASALRMIRERWPEREVLWRPKGAPTPFENLRTSFGNTIEEALRGCSMVVCRHSNVAVDACVAGIPVHCEAGAAHTLYRTTESPSREARLDFLARLSWWEWRKDHLANAFQWISHIVASTKGPRK